MNENIWQNELRQAITDTDELCRILAIPSCTVHTDYPLRIPRPFVGLMERGNPNDPLLLQVLPRSEENQVAHGFTKDPLGEIADADNGVALNKYAGRTLLLASQACGVHCRFCFRRHFPKRNNHGELGGYHHHIEEVILSGGDPLMLDDDELDNLLQSILRMKHVRRIRIHSRLPIVLPSRLTPQLAERLTLPIPVYLVLHVNHPNELSEEFLERRELLVKPVVMAQTVLLRNINDDVETLDRLFRRLIDARILPYYLHQLDRVEGSAHFEVPPEKGLELLGDLRNRLPGYAVPAYVREVAGKSCKEVIVG
ncbi:MAG: KamA family radical SAM protein [Planctomycetaceae bacterium]|nr:KamA family radical SAM protein [Planctomycetaceae bacterium]